MLPWALLFFAAALAGCADQGAPGADDPFAPVITATSPTDGQTGVSTATAVSVTFSEAMDTAATETAFALSPLADGAFSWDAGETAIVFAPAAQLAPDTSYTATMGADAADLAGNLAQPPAEGSPMPLVGTLTTAEIALIRIWIEEGALEFEP